MKVTNRTKSACLAIVRIFETSRPLGDFAAVAVLDDEAGVSYGINQFTHRSGSLLAVIENYLAGGGVIGRSLLEDRLPRRNDRDAIDALAQDKSFEKALRAAAISREMRDAQTAAADQLYLAPAVAACGQLGPSLPLSLAVVYDSTVHGSWAKIRDLVSVPTPQEGGDEKVWITAYVRKRHAWLSASPRLAKTNYRTKFFLGQIAQGRWEFEPPMRVHGVLLTGSLLNSASAANYSAAEPAINPSETSPASGPATIKNLSEASPVDDGLTARSRQNTQPPNQDDGGLGTVEESVGRAARKYDRVEAIVKTVITRKDAAKSLWTTVIGSVWQLVWAIAGFVCGVPRPIWLAAAVIMGVLAALYLYRQISLGRIRELSN